MRRLLVVLVALFGLATGLITGAGPLTTSADHLTAGVYGYDPGAKNGPVREGEPSISPVRAPSSGVRPPGTAQTAPLLLARVVAAERELAARADELHGALDPIAQTRRTTAVMGTRQGTDVLAGGARDLSPAQRALAGPGDVLGRLPGEHAAITALKAAGEAGLTPQGIATTTNICPACRAALEEAGATITGPRSAWWW